MMLYIGGIDQTSNVVSQTTTKPTIYHQQYPTYKSSFDECINLQVNYVNS